MPPRRQSPPLPRVELRIGEVVGGDVMDFCRLCARAAGYASLDDVERAVRQREARARLPANQPPADVIAGLS